MTWQPPPRPHTCRVEDCTRGTADPAADCWVHAPPDATGCTPAGRHLDLRPGGYPVVSCHASSTLVWGSFAATLHGALEQLEQRSRPDRHDRSP